MPTDRNDSGRGLATERSITTRPKIGERSTGGVLSSEPYSPPAALPPDYGSNFFPFRGGPPGSSPFIGGPGTYTPSGQVPYPTIPQGVGAGVVNHGPIYGDDDPYRIAADVFSKFFGAGPVEDTRDNPTIVGDAGVSKGTSFGPILIILLILGGVGYFVYKRYAAQ